MNLCSHNPKTRNERCAMPVHHGFFLLFQFCKNFIGTHPFGKQLFQNGFRFCLFRIFCSFGICLCLLCFQLDNFLVDSFQRCFLLFQVSFQSVNVYGRGYEKKLNKVGIYTMVDVARCSIGGSSEYYNEELLYRLFGVNAELLIDHAWGYEPCTIAQIKAYR